MRKIKTFNVEEGVYKKLLSLFKKYDVNASLSLFVNNCLVELLTHLEEVELASKNNLAYKVPMPFVISEMVKGMKNKKTVHPMMIEAGAKSDPRKLYESLLLTKWEDEYEAQKLGISVEMYSHLKKGGFFVAQNKQYLIEEKTGKKYFVAPDGYGGSILLEIKEEQG
jgi:hypothetical protein